MGAVSSTHHQAHVGGRPVNRTPVTLEQKLLYLKEHSMDQHVVTGILVEIAQMCSRSKRDRTMLLQYMVESTVGFEAPTPIERDTSTPLPATPRRLARGGVTPLNIPSRDKTSGNRSPGPSKSPNTTAAGSRQQSPLERQPLFELMLRARTCLDLQLKTVTMRWILLLLDEDLETGVALMCKSGLLLCLVDFYSFQTVQSVPLATLSLVASIVERCCSCLQFVEEVKGAGEAFAPLLKRIRFTNPGSPERALLLSAVVQCCLAARSCCLQFARCEPLDAMLKCIERTESKPHIVVMALELLGIFVQAKPELGQSIGTRQVATIAKCITDRSQQYYAAAAFSLCCLATCEETKRVEHIVVGQLGKCFQPKFASDMSDVRLGDCLEISLLALKTNKNDRLTFVFSHQFSQLVPRIVELCILELEGASSVDLQRQSPRQATTTTPRTLPIQPEGTPVSPNTAVATLYSPGRQHPSAPPSLLSLATERQREQLWTKNHSNTVNTSFGQGSRHNQSSTMGRSADTGAFLPDTSSESVFARQRDEVSDHVFDLTIQLCSLLSQHDEVLEELAQGGVLHLLLHLMALSPSLCLRSVKLITRICSRSSAASKTLLQQRKFHSLLRKISPDGPADDMRTALEAVRILQAVMMNPAVVLLIDEFLLAAITSLLCHAVSACPLTSIVLTDEARVTREIVMLSLDLLLSRASSSRQASNDILAQMAITKLRTLRNSDDTDVSIAADNLAQALASGTGKEGTQELAHYGLLSTAAERKLQVYVSGKTTLQTVQRFWRLSVQVKKVSRHRAMVASLFKDLFLWYTGLLEDERVAFKKVSISCSDLLSRASEDQRLRNKLELEAERSRGAVSVPENLNRIEMVELLISQRETVVRISEVRKEAAFFSYFAKLKQVSKNELLDRLNLGIMHQVEFEAHVQRSAVRMKAIDRLYELRRFISNDEERRRSLIEFSWESGCKGFGTRQALLMVEQLETHERSRLKTHAASDRLQFLGGVYPVLLSDTVKEEIKARTIFMMRVDAFVDNTLSQKVRLQVSQVEVVARKEVKRWEHLVRTQIYTGGYAVMLQTLQFDEQRARCIVSRSICLEYRQQRPKYRILGCQAAEYTTRVKLTREAKLCFGFLTAAFFTTSLGVIEKEELLAREDVEGERAVAKARWSWDLQVMSLAHYERAHRNALSMQYGYGLRNILLPLVCLRLHVAMETLVLDDLEKRSDVLTLQALERRLLEQDHMQQLQRIIRLQVIAEQKRDNDRLMNHLLSVTHIMMIEVLSQQSTAKIVKDRQRKERYTQNSTMGSSILGRGSRRMDQSTLGGRSTNSTAALGNALAGRVRPLSGQPGARNATPSPGISRLKSAGPAGRAHSSLR